MTANYPTPREELVRQLAGVMLCGLAMLPLGQLEAQSTDVWRRQVLAAESSFAAEG
jgi:hypothetical protein